MKSRCPVCSLIIEYIVFYETMPEHNSAYKTEYHFFKCGHFEKEHRLSHAILGIIGGNYYVPFGSNITTTGTTGQILTTNNSNMKWIRYDSKIHKE